MKRVLSLALAVVMLFTLLPVSALAEEVAAEPAAETEVAEAVQTTVPEEPTEEPAAPSEDAELPAESAEAEQDAEEVPAEQEQPEQAASRVNLAAAELYDIVARGTCGYNLTWALDSKGTLTISGTGAMKNYSSSTDAPWYIRSGSIYSVIIESGVTSIGAYAFEYCSRLTSVTIPDSVTSIGAYAFYDCSRLTEINYNAKAVADLSNNSYVFYNAGTAGDGIKVTFGDSVEKIPAYLFYTSNSSYSPKITSVTIGNSVTSIGEWAFCGCRSLERVYITDLAAWCGITFSDDFSNPLCYAHNLYISGELATDIIIPDSVTSIGSYSFSGCSSLTSVTIPDSVTSIGSYSFSGCSSLTSVTIPDSVTSIGGSAFSGCSSLTSVTIGNSVTSIGSLSFFSCSSLTSVTIPDSVTSIGGSAFGLCISLESVTIGNGVTSIGREAFGSCRSLESVTIGNSVTSIGGRAFYYCSSLTSVTIPDSVTSIGGSAFYNCSSLTSVTIGNSVTSIGYYAFYNCSSLTEINYNAKAVADLSYDSDVFYNAGTAGDGIKVTFGDSVEKIPAYLFYTSDSSYSPKITSVTIGNSVTSIGGSAFYYCSSLTNVTIGDSVTSIGDSAFCNCSSLTSVTIGNGVTSIGDSAFENCSNLTNVTIGNSVTSIGICAFSGCSSLASVTIPNSVTSIGSSAFYDCDGLTSVTIPDGVTSIGNSAFNECWKLKDAAFGGTKEEWEATGYTFPSYVRMHYSCKSLDGHYVPVEVKEPNCQSTGYIKYNCNCGNEYTETLPKSHDYVFSKTVAPTCSEHGYDLLKCSKCGAEKKEYHDDELLQHSYVVSAVEPSCLVGGYKLHKCSICGDSYKDELVQSLGHSETNAEAKTPTCTEAGHTAGTCCSRCGKIMSGMAEIAALGHDFGAWTVTTTPTCTEKGVETRYCSRCDATETRDVDALGHALVHHDGKAAACTEAGWEAYDTCSRCDYTTYKEISALGHDYKDGVCTVCGAKDPDYKPPVVKENPFVDVSESSVYYDAILWAYYHEPQQITGGFTATEFRPGNPCTRGQVVTFLWRAAGCPEPTGDTSMFNDASSIASPYQKAVAWAVENGITTGFADGTFRPNDSVTRAQFVTFLWRYENKPATSGSIAGFTDAASISGPYQQAVAWAVEKGITTGYNDGSFRPNATCTRWAVVLFMYRDMP